jgi:glycoprotein 6-alpha-L-fucosyltransferase
MFYAVNYFNKLSLNEFSGEKFVFVATDGENITQELNQKYPDFKFVDSKQYFTNILSNNNKYSANNLLKTIFDIHFLSKSDFLICTMSSNV